MQRLPIFLTLVASLSLAGIAGAEVVPMGDLHCNNDVGYPDSTVAYPVDEPVEISGIVTAGTGVFAAYTAVNVQDDTGAITLYRNDAPVIFVDGDSINASCH